MRPASRTDNSDCKMARALFQRRPENAPSSAEQIALLRHLEECASCRKEAALAEGADRLLAEASRSIPLSGDLRAGFARKLALSRPPSRHSRSLWAALPVLAAAAFAAALFLPGLHSSPAPALPALPGRKHTSRAAAVYAAKAALPQRLAFRSAAPLLQPLPSAPAARPRLAPTRSALPKKTAPAREVSKRSLPLHDALSSNGILVRPSAFSRSGASALAAGVSDAAMTYRAAENVPANNVPSELPQYTQSVLLHVVDPERKLDATLKVSGNTEILYGNR